MTLQSWNKVPKFLVQINLLLEMDKVLTLKVKGDKINSFSFKDHGSSLKLKELLHAPKINENLVNVSQLTTDNNVIIE